MADEAPGTAPLEVRAAFPPVSSAEWEAAIAIDLNGADYHQQLVRRLEPGLAVQPYYRREYLEELAGQIAAPGAFPFTRGGGAGWEMVQTWAPPPAAIRADQWHEAGATVVQEVGFALGAGVDAVAALTAGGTPVRSAVGGLEFTFAVGSSYFLEIAKLRAARMVWAQACAAFGVEDGASLMRMHVRTSRANKSLYDPYTNLLRVTTEALAAVVGGCQRLTVEPSGFDPHLATNVHRILQEEVHLDAVADPAGGSYYIEALTDHVARNAWSLFQQIESQGGYASQWAAGTIQAALEQSRSATSNAVSSRRRTLVGVNNYPNMVDREPGSALPADPGRASWRMAEPFERLRARTAAHAKTTGHVPRVLLLKRGNLRMRIARANFCVNFFGCAGFDVLETDDLAGCVFDLVVLCSADREYLPFARDVCARLSVPVLVAGKPTDDADALRAVGVQDFVHLECDAVRTLTECQRRLGLDELT